MTVEVHGKPNYQKLAETWLGLLAARDGMSIVPGSVKVELKGEQDDDSDEENDMCCHWLSVLDADAVRGWRHGAWMAPHDRNMVGCRFDGGWNCGALERRCD